MMEGGAEGAQEPDVESQQECSEFGRQEELLLSMTIKFDNQNIHQSTNCMGYSH